MVEDVIVPQHRKSRRPAGLPGRWVPPLITVIVLVVAMIPSASSVKASSANTWTPTGSMLIAHDINRYFTATLLPNGQVLVTGGIGPYSLTGSSDLSSAELYNPSTGMWIATANMSTARVEHTATLLPNGKVLVAGGFGPCDPTCTRSSAELYDPSTGTWTATGSMITARLGARATLLANGKVLVAGGRDNMTVYSSAE